MISLLLSKWIKWWRLPQNILDNPEHHKVILFVTRDFGILGRQRQDHEEPWIRDRIRMAQAQFPRSHQELEGKKCHHLCPFTGNMAQVIPWIQASSLSSCDLLDLCLLSETTHLLYFVMRVQNWSLYHLVKILEMLIENLRVNNVIIRKCVRERELK